MPSNRITTSVTFNCGCGFIVKGSADDIKKAMSLALDHARTFGHTLDVHGMIKVDKADAKYSTTEVTYELSSK